MFGGPHIGIHKDLKTEQILWGKVNRAKQGHITGSCGSLTGCLNGFLNGAKPREIDIFKGHDV